MNWLDPIGASLSLICTFYFTQAWRAAWMIGVAAILINTVLYWQKGIYGSVMLEAIYFVSMVYGWFQWSPQGVTRAIKPIRHLTLKEALGLTTLAVVGIAVGATLLRTFTDSDIAYWDATVTVLSLIAQWLLCIKVMQCWILWFFVDAMVAALQFYKGIPFHSAVHWLYLILAVVGHWRWRKILKYQHAGGLQMA